MGRAATIFAATLFLLSSCAIIPPGQVKKHTAPGQVQKTTGYNPASGKVKVKKN